MPSPIQASKVYFRPIAAYLRLAETVMLLASQAMSFKHLRAYPVTENHLGLFDTFISGRCQRRAGNAKRHVAGCY